MLGYYLASWGMLRGSSQLLKEKNYTVYIPIIEYIIKKKKEKRNIWISMNESFKSSNNEILSKGYIKKYIEIYGEVFFILQNSDVTPTCTLVTKIMLGVFGCIPAFDENLCITFNDLYPEVHFRNITLNFNPRGRGEQRLRALLKSIKDFYDDNKKGLDSYKVKTYHYKNNQPVESDICYPVLKLIDMYGFQKGI